MQIHALLNTGNNNILAGTYLIYKSLLTNLSGISDVTTTSFGCCHFSISNSNHNVVYIKTLNFKGKRIHALLSTTTQNLLIKPKILDLHLR